MVKFQKKKYIVFFVTFGGGQTGCNICYIYVLFIEGYPKVKKYTSFSWCPMTSNTLCIFKITLNKYSLYFNSLQIIGKLEGSLKMLVERKMNTMEANFWKQRNEKI